MPEFKYVAVNSLGKKVNGRAVAHNEADLEMVFKHQGLQLMSAKMINSKKSKKLGKVKIKDKIMFCVHMEQLDKAGVPILDALWDIKDASESDTFRSVLTEIHENVKGGDQLSQALGKRRDMFDDVFIGLVEAGEKTGNLSESFHNLAHHLKWAADLRRAIKKAMTYPMTLLFMMSGVISMMMLFVVPKLVDFLNSQGFELPFYTRALISFSHAFEHYWWAIFGTPILVVVGLIIAYKYSDKARWVIDKVLLKVPGIGRVILKINLARFAHFFSILFNSGLGILECLGTTRKVISNVVIVSAVDSVIKSVSEGNSLTTSLENTGRFPKLVCRMFKVGEDSGNMQAALENVNFFYEREVKDSVDSMIAFIQPTLTVIMGGLMLWITAAVFGPLYASFSKLGF